MISPSLKIHSVRVSANWLLLLRENLERVLSSQCTTGCKRAVGICKTSKMKAALQVDIGKQKSVVGWRLPRRLGTPRFYSRHQNGIATPSPFFNSQPTATTTTTTRNDETSDIQVKHNEKRRDREIYVVIQRKNANITFSLWTLLSIYGSRISRLSSAL